MEISSPRHAQETFQTSEEERLKKATSLVERLPIGVDPKAELILILYNEKPGTELVFSNKEKALETIDVLKKSGLLAEMKEPEKNELNAPLSVLVSKHQETLDELKKINSKKDHKRFGVLMGFPNSAVEGFLGENGNSPLSIKEQDEMTKDLPGLFIHFRFSKNGKDAELLELKRKLKILATVAPGLFRKMYTREKAEEYLNRLSSQD